MLGLFAFLNLRELVFHECDDELWNLICDAEGAFQSQDGKYSGSASSHILHYFSPLLASQMVIKLEVGNGGLTEMGGESSMRISIAKVADVTYILLCQHSSIGMQRLMNLIKRFFRLCIGVMTSGSFETIDEYWTALLRRGFRQLARRCFEEPSCVLEAEQELLIPEDISRQLSALLKKVCGLAAMKYTMERIIMANGWKPVIVYTRTVSSLICPEDIRLLSILAHCCEILSESSGRTCSTHSSQTGPDSLATSTSGSLAGYEYNSSSISLLTDLDMEPLLPSLSPTPSIAHVVVFLRHQDGGIKPHKVYVVQPAADFRLLFLSKPSSTALVPFVYDALQLLDQIQEDRESVRMSGVKQACPLRETYTGLGDVLQRISGSNELRKLPRKLGAKVSRILEDFERGILDDLWSTTPSATSRRLHSNRNGASIKVNQSLMEAKAICQQVLLHFRQADFSHDPIKWTSTVAALNRGRETVQKGLMDIIGFLAVKCQAPLSTTSTFPTLPCLQFVIFVSKDVETKVRWSLEFSRTNTHFGVDLIRDLEAMGEMQQMGSHCDTMRCTADGYRTSFRLFGSLFLAGHARQLRWDRRTEYEVYCWYDGGVKDDVLKSHGLFILSSCLECLRSTTNLEDFGVVQQSLRSLSRCSLWS
ncbi:hypothetical protein RvY_03722 [Ramazzottius varieornatus]|uniref:Uncharacterized protein n=1 Tax=Ramazzottius varieornatus TaxID=947166 RepID=A0A1D1UUR2_RAMVA|nr:hypothetical protein RvY_03722 [Ramazzottius varieornatus]